MKVCIPIAENRGLLSPVSPRFACAAMFLLVDTATLAFHAIPNPRSDGGQSCDPFQSLNEHPIDSFIVEGIDTSALRRLATRHVPVFGTKGGRVADALAAWIAGRLPALMEGTGDPG